MNHTDARGNTLEYDAKNKILKSSAGIGVVEIRNEVTGLVLEWWDFSSKPASVFNIPRTVLCNLDSNVSVLVVCEDIVGNILKQKL